MRHLYVHLPFCRARCAYCDFYAEALPGKWASSGSVPPAISGYRSALETELHFRAPLFSAGLDTVYLGGGTPTLLMDGLLLPVLDEIGPFILSEAEVSVEANPGTLDSGVLRKLQAAGVNRVSLGIQSFSEPLRLNLGRHVSNAEISSAVDAIHSAGPANWNLDLVLGIPGQHRRLLEADLTAAVAAAPTHISLYDLTYTPRYEGFVSRRLGPAACGRAQRASEGAYRFAVDLLQRAGYERYEISNFARPGFECRHNLGYWRGEDYLGVGAAATSTVGLLRWTNPRSVATYAEAWGESGRPQAGFPDQEERQAGRTCGAEFATRELLPALDGVEVERLSPDIRRYEAAMLGLRTREGVDWELLAPVVDREQFAIMLQKGLVAEQRGRITLSAGGLDVSNLVLSAILLPPSGT